MELSVRRETDGRKIMGHPRCVEPTAERCESGGAARIRYGYQASAERFERQNLMFVFTAVAAPQADHRPLRLVLGRIGWDCLEKGDGVYGELLGKARIESLREMFHPSDAELGDFILRTNAEIERCIGLFRETYHKSEEYRVYHANRDRIRRWQRAKSRFDAEYGPGWFEQIYNFDLELMNVDLLENLRHSRGESEETGSAAGCGDTQSLHRQRPEFSSRDIGYMKKFYKLLARQYHPDISHDSGEAMQLLNRLKDFFGF